METWIDIKDFEELYQISNYGRVKSLKYNKERILKSSQDSNGYLQVWFSKDGKRKGYLVHRLVAEAFIPNPDKKPCIDHIDTNPLNNNVNNLRWVSQKENCNNPLSICKYSKANKNKKHSEESKKKMSDAHQKKPINQYDLDGNFIKRWDSINEIKRVGEYNQFNIWCCCKGKRKTCDGFIWEYA